MDRPLISFMVHAQNPDSEFNPAVRRFTTGGAEVISLDIVDMFTNVFVNRGRLHELKDVLVAACERYPVIDSEYAEVDV